MAMFDFLKKKRTEELEPEEELTLDEQARLSRVKTEREFSTPIDEGREMETSLQEYIEKEKEPKPEPTPEPTPEPEMSEQEETKARIEELKLKIEEEKLKKEAGQYTRTGQLKSSLKDTATGILGRSGRSGTAARATKAIRNVATLGGAVHISKARRGYYLPPTKPASFFTGKPLPIAAPKTQKLTTDIRHLNQPVSPSKKGIDLTRLRGKGLDLSKLKQVGTMSTIQPQTSSKIIRSKGIPTAISSHITIGRKSPDIPKTETVIGEWDGSTIYFWDLTEGKSVRGIEVSLTRTANGIYRFRGISETSLAPVSRIVGKNPPRKGQKFGPMRKKREV